MGVDSCYETTQLRQVERSLGHCQKYILYQCLTLSMMPGGKDAYCKSWVALHLPLGALQQVLSFLQAPTHILLAHLQGDLQSHQEGLLD